MSDDLLVTQKTGHCIGGLGPVGEPELDALGVQLDSGGLCQRVVSANDFNKTSVAGTSLFRDHYAVKCTLLLANPGQPNR